MNGARAREQARETELVDALLAAPLLPAAHDAYGAVERRRTALAHRLRRDHDLDLLVTGDCARLVAPAAAVPGLTPRGYACLALCAAALADAPVRLLAAELAERVADLADRAGIDAGAEGEASWRYAFTGALAALRDWGVVTEVDGRLADYATDPDAPVLLGVDPALARAMVKGDRV